MLVEWRLLNDGISEARHHFAVEEALARLLDQGHTPPTLRIRRVRPAVFVGAYQNTWSEVDVDFCRAHDIQIVRRANGGGAVYQEMGSFCFSAFFRRELFAQSDEELYRLFAVPAIRTCADYGVVASFQGWNDVAVGQRKIYGSAQLSWYSAFVQSGTFLVNMNFDVMERALTPPDIKFAGKTARSIRERVTSLSNEVGRVVDTQEVIARFVINAADTLGLRLVPGDLTTEELALADELLAVKYSTDAWNFGSQKAYQLTVANRSNAGVLSLSVDMEGETIHQARVTGDLLLSDRHELEILEHSLAGVSLQEAQTAIQTIPISTEIQQSLLQLLAKLAREVADISSSNPKGGQT